MTRATGPIRLYASVALAVLVVALLLSSMGYAVASTQSSERSRAIGNFDDRAATSASFVTSLVEQLAGRERQAADALLTGAPDAGRLSILRRALGFRAAVELSLSGRVLAEATGAGSSQVATAVPTVSVLRQAERGGFAASDLVGLGGGPGGRRLGRTSVVVGVVARYATPSGPRLLAGDYVVGELPLATFLQSSASIDPHHQVFLVGPGDVVLVGPGRDAGASLATVSPDLAAALARGASGTYGRAHLGAIAYASVAVDATPWRLVATVPLSEIVAGTAGLATEIPWILFGVASFLCVLLTAIFARSLRDRRALHIFSMRMEHAARTDTLTGLPNRLALETALQGLGADGGPVSLLMIDLDHFKQVNDTFGHEAGDEALRAVADAMRTVFRKSDTYGRWGGDEFVAILPSATAVEALHAGERLSLALMSRSIDSRAGAFVVAASVGCATSNAPTWRLMLEDADRMLYAAKAEKRAREASTLAPYRVS